MEPRVEVEELETGYGADEVIDVDLNKHRLFHFEFQFLPAQSKEVIKGASSESRINALLELLGCSCVTTLRREPLRFTLAKANERKSRENAGGGTMKIKRRTGIRTPESWRRKGVTESSRTNGCAGGLGRCIG